MTKKSSGEGSSTMIIYLTWMLSFSPPQQMYQMLHFRVENADDEYTPQTITFKCNAMSEDEMAPPSTQSDDNETSKNITRKSVSRASDVSSDVSALTTSDDHKAASSSQASENNDERETASDDRKPSRLEESETVNADDNGNSDGGPLSNTPPVTCTNLRPFNESFPLQLTLMLNRESEAGSESIRWLSDGDGFEIVDQNAFEKEILPKYFRLPCIFQSFVRRLYRYVDVGVRFALIWICLCC
jgi:hypothetical protein